jgi:hypothetical protein
MSDTAKYLLEDARQALRRRVSEECRTELSQVFAAWLMHGTDLQNDAEFALFVSEAAIREGAQQDFHTVSILGFGAAADMLAEEQIDALKKGLRRQAGRAVVIDELPAAFCSNAVGILGMVLGAKAVADSEIMDRVLNWASKFLKKSYHAERAEEWQRCLFAAADLQLGGLMKLSIPMSPGVADVRVALVAKSIIDTSDGGAAEDADQTLRLAIRDLTDELCDDRAALRLLAVESVIGAAIPTVGSHSSAPPTKPGSHSGSATKSQDPALSDRDSKVHDAIGAERFRTLTNAELMRKKDVKRKLGIENIRGTDAAKSCFDRIEKPRATRCRGRSQKNGQNGNKQRAKTVDVGPMLSQFFQCLPVSETVKTSLTVTPVKGFTTPE